MNSVDKLLEFANHPTEIAKMSSFDLAAKANKAVKSAMRYAEELSTKAETARRERNEVAAKLASAEGDRREELSAELAAKDKALHGAIQRRNEAVDGFNSYMEEQRQLFASKKLDPYRRYKEMIIPCGTQVMPDGRELQLMRILPRDESLEPVDMDDDDHKLSVASSRSYGDSIGLARDQRRGKYNDASMLINQQAANFDPGEISPFHMACN